MGERRPHILLGCCGSVAAVKVPVLVQGLSALGEVRVVTTAHAEHFFAAPVDMVVYHDADEWTSWRAMGDPVLHIELRRWADVFVVAPLDANTLAKLSGGLCDNLLTCVARCWDFAKPLLVAPAMNTAMWTHPVTAPQVATLCHWGVRVVPPVAKRLACGDVGPGAMAEWSTIVDAVQQALSGEADAAQPQLDGEGR